MPDDDVQRARRHLLVKTLASEGIRNEQVLAAVQQVPRHLFVGEARVDVAYEDRALPIGDGQTISQPYVVALMTEALRLTERDRVLEVGTGSGYQTAILSVLAGEVHTVERHQVLHEAAAERLRRLGYDNVTCHMGDGSCGLPELAPFDAVCVTAAAPRIPDPLREQLRIGGRMVIPLGVAHHQTLRALTRTPAGEIGTTLTSVLFVPLIGKHGWDPGEERAD